jgi:hypothetical protein
VSTPPRRPAASSCSWCSVCSATWAPFNHTAVDWMDNGIDTGPAADWAGRPPPGAAQLARRAVSVSMRAGTGEELGPVKS